MITRNYAGVKASVRDFSSDIVEAMAQRFDRVVVALIGPLQGIEARDNIIGVAIPPGRATVDSLTTACRCAGPTRATWSGSASSTSTPIRMS